MRIKKSSQQFWGKSYVLIIVFLYVSDFLGQQLPKAMEAGAVQAVASTDTDGDGIPDTTDIDDDNDGILDLVENPCLQEQQLQEGYEAFWDFENTTDDTSPNGHHRVNTVTPQFSNESISGDFSVNFDGTYGLQYNDDPFLNRAISTLSHTLWIRPAELNMESTYFILDEGGGADGVAIRLINQSGNFYIEGKVAADSESKSLLAIDNPILIDTWFFVTISFDEGAIALSVNDTFYYEELPSVSEIRQHRNAGGYGANFSANAFGSVSSDYFIGQIDAIKYYEKALTAEEIQLLYSDSSCDVDSDNDGISNHLDLDSDSDGIPDAIEAQSVSGYIPPLGTDANGNGLDDRYDSSISGGTEIIAIDTDDDGVEDYVDIDSDNDGILDHIEGNSNGLDSDTDGFPDHLDLDSDGDGIPDNIEAQSTIGYIPPSIPFTDSDTDGLEDTYENTASGGGEGLTPEDTDEDNIPDYIDVDSDDDGTDDKDESGLTLGGAIGTNGLDNTVDTADNYADPNGIIDDPANDLADFDGDVLIDYRDAIFDLDTDNDGLLDKNDIDDDNDGILDAIENPCVQLEEYEAFWDFENTTNDSSINKHNLQNSPTNLSYSTISVSGGHAVDFDGSYGLRYNDSPFLNAPIDALTHTFWIRPGMLSNARYMILDQGGTVNGLSIYLEKNESAIYEIHAAITISNQITYLTGSTIDSNTWYFVAVSFDHGTFNLHVNDQKYTASTIGTQLGNHTNQGGYGASFDVNALNDSSVFNFIGQIDAIKYYEKALTSTQIQLLYTNNSGSCTSADNDNDGIPNHVDLDSDGDGIPDNIEAQTTLGYIPPGVSFTDTDTDGLEDTYEETSEAGGEGLTPLDTDADAIPDYLDVDSDDDGTEDIDESGLTLGGTVGVNGLDDAVESTDNYADPNGAIDNPYDLADLDRDLIPEYRDALFELDTDKDDIPDLSDIDDDNDGILDAIENPCVQLVEYEAFWDFENTTDDGSPNGHNRKNNVTPQYSSESISGNFSANFDGTYGLQYNDNPFLNAPISAFTHTLWIRRSEMLAGTPYMILDQGGAVNGLSIYLQHPGTWNFEMRVALTINSQTTYLTGSNIEPNTWYFVAVSFNQGVLSLHVNERRYNATVAETQFGNHTNQGGYGASFDANALNDSNVNNFVGQIDAIKYYEKALTTEQIRLLYTNNSGSCSSLDNDNDGIDNHLDLDSDNDGIPDNIEAQTTLGYIAPGAPFTDNDADGLGDTYENTASGGGEGLAPINTDNTDEPDYLDTDSDNDGKTDSDETGFTLSGTVGTNGLDSAMENSDNYTDPNGIIDDPENDLEDLDGDTFLAYRDATFDFDNDGDGVFDINDIDDDNDGIVDTLEAGTYDADGDEDGDGLFNYKDTEDSGDAGDGSATDYSDANMDGIADVFDADDDGVPNHLDLDADGDGIPDNIEAQYTRHYVAPNPDDNNMYFTNNGLNSAYGTSGLTPIDTDKDNSNTPDYLDADADDDGINDRDETELILSGIVGTNGLDSAIEDSDDYSDPNGTLDNPESDLPDSDADFYFGGEVDFRDPISDADTDSDAVPDRFDDDSDNDGILNAVEAPCALLLQPGGLWNFGHNLLDFSGNLHHFDTELKFAASGGANGGAAINFNKNAAERYLVNESLLRDKKLKEFSYSLWINPRNANNNNNNQLIIDHGGVTDGFALQKDPSGVLEIGLQSSGVNHAMTTGISVALGDWYHLVFSFNRGNYTLYVRKYGETVAERSVFSGSTEITELISDSAEENTLSFGGFGTNAFGVANTYSFVGLVDAIRYYPKALSLEQVDLLFDNYENNCTAIDTDTDGVLNNLDLDSDNDGIPDIIEAQSTAAYTEPSGNDTDGDGLDDAFDTDNGGATIVPEDTDQDGVPDYLDTDADGDSALDKNETGFFDFYATPIADNGLSQWYAVSGYEDASAGKSFADYAHNGAEYYFRAQEASLDAELPVAEGTYSLAYDRMNGTLTILNAPDTVEGLTLYDFTGQLIQQWTGNSTSYDVSQLRAGLYIAELRIKDHPKTVVKFIVY